jgi:hypothetical protein
MEVTSSTGVYRGLQVRVGTSDSGGKDIFYGIYIAQSTSGGVISSAEYTRTSVGGSCTASNTNFAFATVDFTRQYLK